MAIAPLNTFKTVAVPVAPGEQVVYTAPVGVSAILLYAQVANVGVSTIYPKFTLIHRRASTVTGNVRDNRVVKDLEVPLNDSLIALDGRLVLERTPILSDSLVITSSSTAGIVSVYDCKYDNTTGITTITTYGDHNFNVNDQITMSGLAFTCTGSTGITTTIYPAPQASFTVTNVGTSTVFTTNSGVIAGIKHFYNGGGLVGPLKLEFLCSILENSTV